MRINNLDNVMKVYKSKVNTKDNKKIESKKEDKIELSNEAMSYRVALNKLKELPETREEKIENIKMQIEAGTYEIDSDKIAEKMVGDANLRRMLNSW